MALRRVDSERSYGASAELAFGNIVVFGARLLLVLEFCPVKQIRESMSLARLPEVNPFSVNPTTALTEDVALVTTALRTALASVYCE
jgi:hypothetical protein